MTSRQSTLRLYKEILYSAQRFPSIKRDNIVKEIKVSFRENRQMTDQKEIDKHLGMAYDGLSKLSMYSTLPKSSNTWAVNMDRQPMPRE